MTIKINGNWEKGLAFDVHTLSSTYLGPNEYGHDQWDSTRSDMGELVYQLKYNGDRSSIPKIIELLEKIKGIDHMDYLIPVPSTNKSRIVQPVVAITRALGERHNVAVIEGLITKTAGGSELKNVNDPDERLELLRERMSFTGTHDVSGAKILLVDDLYRSGATLRVATDLLYQEGDAAHVSVLTMTKTRTRR